MALWGESSGASRRGRTSAVARRRRRLVAPAALCALIVLALAAARSPAANIWTVTTTADANDGACTPALCTLRDAVAAAQNGDSVYVPKAASDYTLTLGDITIANNITIYGDGARSSVISGANASRVFTMTATGDVLLTNLRITGGNGTSALNNNVGGGIYQQYGNLTLVNVSLDHNSAGVTGGGLDTNGAALTVYGSTVADNSATSFAGGIDSQYGPPARITNSTIADNTAGSFAGGIALPGAGGIVLANDTITGNVAASGAAGVDHGGGTPGILNTLIAGNTTGGVEHDCASIPTGDLGYNISGDASCSFTGTGDQQNVTAPQLGPLQDNGGGTDTVALLAGSPAIDAGWVTGCPPTDQRGYSRPDADEPSGSPCDIGAYESGPQGPAAITGAPTSVDPNTESLAGTVNPNGQSTTYHFDYATDAYFSAHSAYDQSTADASAGSGSAAQPVTAQLAGLTPGTTYDYRLVATNALGTSTGVNGTFTTPGAPTTSTTSSSTATSTAAATSSRSTPASPPGPSPDLALSVSHLDPFSGASGVYHVQIANRGTGPTSGAIHVSAQLPPGITYAGATSGWSCSASGGSTVSCDYGGGAIAAGQGATLDIDVMVAATSHGGSATVTLGDPGDTDAADKTAADPTTVSGAGAVATTLAGGGALYAGAAATLTLGLTNRTAATLAAGTSVDFTVPTGGPGAFAPGASATGNGWVCSVIAIYGADMIHCADSDVVGAGTAANALALSVKAPVVSSRSSAAISYEVRSAAGGVLAGPITQAIAIVPTARARLALALNGPMALAKAAEHYLLAVTNPGPGATVAPTAVSVTIPSGVSASAPTGTGWACAPKTGGWSCVYGGRLAGGAAAAPLALSLAGTPGAASPVNLIATASSADAVGPIAANASLAVDQPPAGVPNPVVRFTPLAAPHTNATGSARYAVTVANTGDGRSGAAPLTLSETLPPGVTAQGSGPGWSCRQQGAMLSCAYAPSGSPATVLGTGGKTPPLTVTLGGTGSFAGGSVPVNSRVGVTSTSGATYTSNAIGHVSVAHLQAPLVAPVFQVDAPIASPGDTVHATLGITNTGLAATTGPVAVGFVLPAGLRVAQGAYGAATPDDRLPAPGSVNATPVPVVAGSGPGMSCAGSGASVVCVADSLAAVSQTTVTIPVTVVPDAMGTLTMQGGIVQVSPNSLAHELATVEQAVATQGASALASLTPVNVTVKTFTADAGAAQTMPAAIEHPDGTVSATPVNLDASRTLDVGKPLTFAWVQTTGPTVSWAASPPGATPGTQGSSLAAFPPRTFISYAPGSVGAHGLYSAPQPIVTSPGAYGAKASFTYPDPRSLSGPTTFGFELYVTDGTLVRTASTSVTLDPPPPAPPVAPTMCVWDVTRTPARTPATCLQASSATPNAGDQIVAGPPRAYLRDAGGHTLHYLWALAQPTAGSLAKLQGQAPCLAGDLACFRWPAHVAVVALRATISNGQHDASGAPEQAVASVSFGHSPPPLAVSVSAPPTPALAGSTVTLVAAVRGGASGAVYSWTQTGGPQVSGLNAQGASLSFTAPAPTSAAATVTFQVTARSGAGAAASSGTGEVTVALAPAPALGVNVAPASGTPPSGGLSVATGATLALHAAGTGGSGGPYTFTWSVAGGGGTVTAASTSDSADAIYAPAGTFTGVASLKVTVKDAGGATADATIPIVVGSVASFSPMSASTGGSGGGPSPAPCPAGGPLASILSQLAGGGAALTLGPFTLDLGQPTGTPPSCADWTAGSTLSFAAAHVVIGPFTLTGVAATLSSGGLTLNSGTVSAPSNWNLGSGSISSPIDVSFDGAPSGAISWSGSLPWLAVPGSASGVQTTVTLGAASATLAATATVAGANASLNATIPLTGSAGFEATVTATGANVSGTGHVTVADDGTVTPNVVLTAHNLTPIANVSVTSAQLTWTSAGLTLSAQAMLAGSVGLTLVGAYQDSDDWSATAQLTGVQNPSWLPAGVSLSGATLTGAVTDKQGSITFDVKLDLPNAWTFASGGNQLVQISELSADFSNATPPDACAPLFANAGAGGQPIWLDLAGNATVTLPGNLPAIQVSADACVDPGSASFVLTTAGFSGWTPFSGVPLTLDGLSLTVADLPSSSGNGNTVSVTAAGKMTADGVTAAATLSLLPDGGLVAVGSIPDLSSLGLPLPGGTSGAVIFSTKKIPDLSSAPASLFAGTGIRQSDLAGTGVDADSLAVLASFALPSNLQCLLDQAIYKNPCSANGTPPSSGNAAPGSLVVSADLGAAVPTITASLSAGTNGLTIFTAGATKGEHPSYVSLALNSIDLQISLDGTFSVGGDATLTLPTPGGGGESTLNLAADVSLDPTGPSIAMAATVGPSCDSADPSNPDSHSALCNLLGVRGLDLGALSVQLGINFATTPIPTPTFGFAAAVNAIPCRWAHTIGDAEAGCDANGGGTPDPGSPGAEPMSIAVNIADTGPIFAFQIGLPNNRPVLKFGNALTVDDASLVVAPVGGTIGAGPNAVTFAPGFSLSFDAQVLGVPLSVKAAVDPLALSVKASASVGTIDLGPLTVKQTMFNLAIDPSDGINVGFTGGVDLAGTTLQATLKVQASTSGPPSFSLTASGGNVRLGGNALVLDNFDLSAQGALADGPAPLPQISLEGSASATLLGHQMALAGGVTLTPGLGITGASFYADPGDLSYAGVTLSGNGCGPNAPAGLPASGPCVGASFSAFAATPLSVTVSATASVEGLGVNFDGTVDGTGINVTNASVSLTDPLDPTGRPAAQQIGSLTGRLWLGSSQALQGLTAYDPNLGHDVQVHNGDFEVSGSGQLVLAGFDLNGSFQFGALMDGGGTAFTSTVSAFASATLDVGALGSSATITGDFSADSSGNLSYGFAASGQLVSLDGYPIASAFVALSSSSGLSVRGSLNLGGVSAMVKGNLSLDRDGNLLYSVSGAGSVNVLGTNIGGQISVANEDGYGDPLGYVAATAAVDASFDNTISFNGSASFGTDGTVCGLQGSATVDGITGTASFCGGADPAITLSFSYDGYSVTGQATGSDWSVSGQVAPASFTIGGGLAGFSASVSANWAFDFDVSSARGFSFNVDGSAAVTGSTPIWGPDSATASLSGSPSQVCATGTVSDTVLGQPVSATFQACADSSGIHITEPNPPF